MKNTGFTIFHKSSKKGFTLVEMIVSMAIFAVVAVVALGAMAKIISANRKAQALQSSITNLNYALDAMARDIAVGVNFNADNGPMSLPGIIGNWSYSNNLIIKGGTFSAYPGSVPNNVYVAFNNVSDSEDVSFSTPCNLIYAYQFRNDSNNIRIEKAKQRVCSDGLGSSNFKSVVDESVTITGYYLDVKVNFGPSIAKPYPLITLRVSGYAGVREKERSYFEIQTAVSPRQK